MLKDEDDLSWYARKADGLRKGIGVASRADDDADRAARVSALLETLRRGGIKGSLERRTLYTTTPAAWLLRLPGGQRHQRLRHGPVHARMLLLLQPEAAHRRNLVAREFDTEPVERALRYLDETAVEVPVIPERLAEMREMVLRLDALGVPFLKIHELFACRENAVRVAGHGYDSGGGTGEALLWEPVAAGDEAALPLLLFALENATRLSVYYCSCKTQQDISSRGMRRRLTHSIS